MMHFLRNSKLMVFIWIFIIIYPLISTSLHFLTVDHHNSHSNEVELTSYNKITKHCPYADFDFYWAIQNFYKYTAKRFNLLRNIENEPLSLFDGKIAPLYFQLRAPPFLI